MPACSVTVTGVRSATTPSRSSCSGSVLSHLAILAREAAEPTIVGYTNASRDLAEGREVLVDGDTGRVTLVAADV